MDNGMNRMGRMSTVREAGGPACWACSLTYRYTGDKTVLWGRVKAQCSRPWEWAIIMDSGTATARADFWGDCQGGGAV